MPRPKKKTAKKRASSKATSPKYLPGTGRKVALPPKLAPLLVPIGSIAPDPANPRVAKDIKHMAGLLKRFGFTDPVGVTKDGMIEAGHNRLAGAKLLGATQIPTVVLAHDPVTAAAYNLAHNRSNEVVAGWDELARNALLAKLHAEDEELTAALGWAEDELAAMLAANDDGSEDEGDGEGSEGEHEDVEPPPPPADPVTKLGEVVQLGPHTLHCADCMEVMAQLPDNSVDAVVTDPPYGLSPDGRARTWDDIEELRKQGKGPKSGLMGKAWDAGVPGVTWAREVLRVLKPGGHIIAYSSGRTYHRLAVSCEDAGFMIRTMLDWLYWSGWPKSMDISAAIDRRNDTTTEAAEVAAWICDVMKGAGLGRKDIDKAFSSENISQQWTTSWIDGAVKPRVPRLDQVPLLLSVLGVEDPPPRIATLLLELNSAKGQPGPNWWKREVTGHHSGPAAGQTWSGNVLGSSVRPAQERRDIASTPEAAQWKGWGTAVKGTKEPAVFGQKPISEGTIAANVLKWGTGGLNIDACRIPPGDPSWPGPNDDGEDRWPADIFCCPKPSTRERTEGCTDDMESHSTVKPIKLMRRDLMLITPPGGVVLEPFAGSGTTLVAAKGLDLTIIAVEREPGYCDIIRARCGEPATR